MSDGWALGQLDRGHASRLAMVAPRLRSRGKGEFCHTQRDKEDERKKKIQSFMHAATLFIVSFFFNLNLQRLSTFLSFSSLAATQTYPIARNRSFHHRPALNELRSAGTNSLGRRCSISPTADVRNLLLRRLGHPKQLSVQSKRKAENL